MNKSELITWIATLAEDDPRLGVIGDVLRGNDFIEHEEPLLTLKETAASISYHYSSLHRLDIQKAGHRITPSGRLRYKISEVKAYLASAECAAVRDKLRQTRRHQERSKS